jgi:hypothetical protein
MKNLINKIAEHCISNLKKFAPEERSSFSYWYNHWKAYNIVAVRLGQWKFKYLFHDIEKPFLRLFWDYPRLQKYHRKNNKHHIFYKNPYEIDWEAVVIDWECSRYTKLAHQLPARDQMQIEIVENPGLANLIKLNVPLVLAKFGL